MAAIIAHHIKGKEIPSSWVKSRSIDPEQTFRVIVEPEPEVLLTKEERNRWLDRLEQFEGNEDSEEWIRKIKSARTRSELKVPSDH